MTESKTQLSEPWLRGTWTEVPAVTRGVLHALELAREDLHKWCGPLSKEQLHAKTAGLPSVGFHLRHIAGSVDRLLVGNGDTIICEQCITLAVARIAEARGREALAVVASYPTPALSDR